MNNRILNYLKVVLFFALLAAVVLSFIPGISSGLQRAVVVVFGLGIFVFKIVLPIKKTRSSREGKRSILFCWIDVVLGTVFVTMIVLALFTKIQIHWAFIALDTGLLLGLSFLKDKAWFNE